MILSEISLIDCFVFLIFLTPALIVQAGLGFTVFWVIKAAPYIGLQIPYLFVKERFFTSFQNRSPFVQRSTLFQDFVIRCVRYAFANMPAKIGRVFFSKQVSLPFMYFRMLRHGHLGPELKWREVVTKDFTGIKIVHDENRKPDVVVYYCHGGGFSMGSSYFYMEFLMAWVTLLKEAGFKNPALFALEYTLVPDAVYPTQMDQVSAGYDYVTTLVEDPDRVAVAGDSAGCTLILSLLLRLSENGRDSRQMPGLAVMISPWTTILSPANRNTASDYLDSTSLEVYGKQYLGKKTLYHDETASPGECKDVNRWSRASPSNGWLFLFGSEEVLGPECRALISRLRQGGAEVAVHEEQGGIHAWPVATLYLGETKEARLHGLRQAVKVMKGRFLDGTKGGEVDKAPDDCPRPWSP